MRLVQKQHQWVGIFLGITFLLAGLCGSARQSDAAPTISFQPSSPQVDSNGSELINIYVSEIPQTGLSAFQIQVKFDPAKIQVSDPNAAGLTSGLLPYTPLGGNILCGFIRVGNFNAPCPDPQWFLTSTGRAPQTDPQRAISVDNTNGLLNIAYGSTGTQAPPTGAGVIAIFRVTGVSDGLSQISFQDARGSDNVAPIIPYNFVTVESTITVGAACTPTAEICDGIDNDCDGIADNGIADIVSGSEVGECQTQIQSCVDGRMTVTQVGVGPAAEVCDGLDNNCNGSEDEDYADLGSECSAGLGACLAGGVMVCSPAGDGTVCNAVAGAPIAEVCNGQDDDCDGTPDDNIADIVSGMDVGACQSQIERCTSGSFQVVQAGIVPAAEVCEGAEDEDCDGAVDNGCTCTNGSQRACGSDTGACQAGVETCESGQWGACAGEVGPAAETCDGVDNNCDGQTDEELLNACGTCGPAPDEVCDGVDNNCDGQVDEGVLNACGTCGDVPVEICDTVDNDCDGQTDEGVQNACGACGPAPDEVCDGQDNNCDGQVDEGVLNACGACGDVPVEICDTVDNDCDGQTDEGVQNACGACGPVPDEVCDGVDNNCDGQVDEGVLNACGACGDVPVEICDTVDNDCDGQTDEDFTDLGSECTEGISACAVTGTLVCSQNGLGTVCNAVARTPSPEICDGIDNDCNERIDDSIDLDDGNACTTEACIYGNEVHASVDVDDNDPCTLDTCDPTTGIINNTLVNTDDGDICTIDACDPSSGIITHLPDPSLPDLDLDGIPDLCDGDMDGDQWPNGSDNCPATPNNDQTDTDGDGDGDACDEDDDNDTVPDVDDNCVRTANPGQEDMNGDGTGDACDDDRDGDGRLNDADNCSDVPNPDQHNADTDALGNECDPDDDDDGRPDSDDNCPDISNPNQENADGDSEGDLCDQDDDNDGKKDTWYVLVYFDITYRIDFIGQNEDNCPQTPNADQIDTNGDGEGDACDNDLDGDGIINTSDNCMEVVNPDQVNTDGDSYGDACDSDDDNDGVEDASDNCPLKSNVDQSDSDGDGKGDACDPMGDLNNDGKVDMADYTVFRSTLGKCRGNPAYIAEADYDKDGCVTLRDYAIWYGYYQKNK